MDDKITIERETLQQLYDELETVEYDADPPKRVLLLMDKLRAALAAQPAEPVEPVAKIILDTDGECGVEWIGHGDGLIVGAKLYYRAQPAPAAVPLTDEQIDALMSAANLSIVPEGWTVDAWVVHRVARAVERAHGIAAAGDKP